MKQCTDLIRALAESVDPQFRAQILSEMVPEINVKNLKNKMVEVFHFKVGISPEKQRIYYANKVKFNLSTYTPLEMQALSREHAYSAQEHVREG
jgi:hypothetical protein